MGECEENLYQFFMGFEQSLYDDSSIKKEWVTDGFYAQFSICPDVHSCLELKRRLRLTSVYRIKALYTNHVVCKNDKVARQSVYVQNVIFNQEGKIVFEYAGRYSNSYQWKNHKWLLNECRYDLDMSSGENLLKYKLNDPVVYGGHPLCIVSEYDAPWRGLKDSPENRTDEEKALEIIYKYAYAIDNGDWYSFVGAFNKEGIFENIETSYIGADRVLEFLKQYRHTVSNAQHALFISKMKQSGGNMVVEGYLLRNCKFKEMGSSYSELKYAYKARYIFTLRKEREKFEIYRVVFSREDLPADNKQVY